MVTQSAQDVVNNVVMQRPLMTRTIRGRFFSCIELNTTYPKSPLKGRKDFAYNNQREVSTT